jgi:hypothetical protein
MMVLSLRSALSTAVAVLVMAHGAPAAAQKTRPAPAEPPPAQVPPETPPPYPPLEGADAQAIRGVVREYQQAVARRDGAAAARLVTRDTRGYYGRMRDMAVAAPEAQVRAAPLMERLMILMYRHRVAAGELRALPADSAFAYTIRAGWLAGDADDDVASQGQIFGQDDRAILRIEGEDVHFLREGGVWRWDMVPTLMAASEAFAPDPDSGMTEDEFVIFVLEQGTGQPVSPRIWQPLP